MVEKSFHHSHSLASFTSYFLTSWPFHIDEFSAGLFETIHTDK